MSDDANQKYRKEDFNKKQWAEIEEGQKSGVDVDLYACRFLHYKEMRLIRTAQELGLDVSILSAPKLNYQQRVEIYLGLLYGVNVFAYAKEQYNEGKMREVRLGFEKGLDLTKYLDTHNHNQIHQIRLGLEANLDVSKYDDVKYKQAHMAELRMAMMNGIEINPLLDDTLSIDEVRKRRSTLESQKGGAGETKVIY